jgi:peptide/nickel transport system permease protein
VAGAAIVGFLVLFAIVVPLISSIDPNISDFAHGISPQGTPAGPSSFHFLGTDRIFRDELVRLAWGARLSLLIGVLATVIANVIGGIVGIVAGYYEGHEGVRVPWHMLGSLIVAFVLVVSGHVAVAKWIILLSVALWITIFFFSKERWKSGPRVNADTALMRLVDVGLSFPFLLLVMAIGAALERTTVTSVLIILGLTGWLGTARLLRSKTLQVRNLDFVLASRALGESTPRILLRHVLPNVAGPLIVVATVSVAQMIVAESVLSYLGVGISPPTSTWGLMLFDGQDYYLAAPWLFLCPALAIMIAVFGFNLLGEGLHDALDPRDE